MGNWESENPHDWPLSEEVATFVEECDTAHNIANYPALRKALQARSAMSSGNIISFLQGNINSFFSSPKGEE